MHPNQNQELNPSDPDEEAIEKLATIIIYRFLGPPDFIEVGLTLTEGELDESVTPRQAERSVLLGCTRQLKP